MQKRNYYRAGWIKFKDDADMTAVIDRLSEEKVRAAAASLRNRHSYARQIEGFKLHVTHSTRPFSARARYAPESSWRPDRVEKDLANVKKLASLLEEEAAELRRLPAVLAEPQNLPRSQGGELPNEASGAESGGDAVVNANNEAKNAPSETDQIEIVVEDDPREPKNRGSNAIEERIEQLSAEMLHETKPPGDGVLLSEATPRANKVGIGLRSYWKYNS
jgi:hypothetical protein